jgi:hypothetical protein
MGCLVSGGWYARNVREASVANPAIETKWQFRGTERASAGQRGQRLFDNKELLKPPRMPYKCAITQKIWWPTGLSTLQQEYN